MTEIDRALFEQPEKDFTKHLNLPFNNRIIFSGQYGIGKTTFLKHYFEDSEHSPKYNTIHLFPVNYSVLSNEDIIKYLKYDILFELIIKGKVDLEIDNISSLEYTKLFLSINFPRVLESLILLLPKVGKQLFDFKTEMNSFLKDYEEMKSRWENQSTSHLDSFLKGFHFSEDSIYEYDAITELITHSLEKVKEDDIPESILIVDDLDRIEPKHIFRIFNVFAAHFDKRNHNSENKFGFDKVVFVCDLENIKGIFKNNYGIDVDFNGYVDKFYSRKVYYFNNRKKINESIAEIASKSFPKTIDTRPNDGLLNMARPYKSFLEYIFLGLLDTNQMNLRVLFKFKNKDLDVSGRKITVENNHDIHNTQCYLLLLIDVLFEFFGSYSQLYDSIRKCSSQFHTRSIPDYFDVHIGTMCLILNIRESRFYDTNDKIGTYRYSGCSIKYEINKQPGYTVYHSFSCTGKSIKVEDKNGQDVNLNILNPFEMLADTLDLLHKYGYFRQDT